MTAINSTREIGPSILVVDDEVRQRQSLMQMISPKGYSVETAGSAEEAIKILKDENFDILLLDLNMPGIGGFGVIDYVVANQTPSKVIVVSGDASFETVRQALQQGAHDFVKKPYSLDELLNTIQNAVSKKALEDEHHKIGLKLEKSEYLHRFIVDHSPDIVFILDTEGRFTFLNDTVNSILGYNKHELLGEHFSKIVSGRSQIKANSIFSDRRFDNAKPRNVELIFKCQGDAENRYFDTSSVSVVLNKTVVNKEGQFKGTYGVARDITEKKQAQGLIKFQAYHDLLTKLPNRALMEDRLNIAINQAQRKGENLAVMFLDLDRFKWVNDTMGHTMGDRLLQSVSLRLKECLRSGDTLSRFGGDEFVIVLPQINHRSDAEVIANKLLKQLKTSFVIDNHELYVSGSIGIAIYPDAGEDMETLIQSADLAMYNVKDRGKNSYEFYSKEMNVSSTARLTIERELHKALLNGDLRVCYQPQVNAKTEEIVGFEALVRWQHPEHGTIFPDEFIPVAEETGLILEIGEFVLKTACQDLLYWRRQGIDNIQVSINFSARQLDQDDFIDNIIHALQENKLPCDCLEVEITENTIMNNISPVIQKLKLLTSHGIKIAIDDFGTGYSSLSYLQYFPVNTLKIDKTFVESINVNQGGTSIINAIVAMAQGLDLQLIAEGVETDPQLDHLKSLGCTVIQGWLFGKPESARTTSKLLERIRNGEVIRECVAA